MRLSLVLNVNDLERAVDFNSRTFGVPAHRRKPDGYADSAIENPRRKLVLFGRPGAGDKHQPPGERVGRAIS